MTMTDVTQLAREGDPRAIAALLNRSLQPKGVTAKAALSGTCLKIMLESAQPPSQANAVKFIRNGLERLAPEKIETVKLYGKQVGEAQLAWNEEFELKRAVSAEAPSPEISTSKPKVAVSTQPNPHPDWWINLPGWQKNSLQLVGMLALLLTVAYCRQNRPSIQEVTISECYDELKETIGEDAKYMSYSEIKRACEQMQSK